MPARRLTREPRGRTKLWCDDIESNPYYVEGSGVPVSDELHVNGSRHYYNLFWRKASGDDPKLLSIMIEGERKRMAQLLKVASSELEEFISRKKQNDKYNVNVAKEVRAVMVVCKSYNKHLERYNEYMDQFFKKIEPAMDSALEAHEIKKKWDLDRIKDKVKYYKDSTNERNAEFEAQPVNKDDVIEQFFDLTEIGDTLNWLAMSIGKLRNIE